MIGNTNGFRKGNKPYNFRLTGFNKSVVRTPEWKEKIRESVRNYWKEVKKLNIYPPSEYGDDWIEELRELIRDKYFRRCFDCGRLETTLVGRIKKLSVHHINTNKLDCSEDNLVPLCHSCHIKRHQKIRIRLVKEVELKIENSLVLAE